MKQINISDFLLSGYCEFFNLIFCCLFLEIQTSLQSANEAVQVKNPIKANKLQKRQTVAKFSHLILKSSYEKEKAE